MTVEPMGRHLPAWALQHSDIPMSDAYLDEALDDLADYLQFATGLDGVDLSSEGTGSEGWRLVGQSPSGSQVRLDDADRDDRCDDADADDTHEPDTEELWDRLRTLETTSANNDLERTQILEILVRRQAADDAASQNDRIERGLMAPRHRKSDPVLLDEARVCVVDTAVATLGGSAGVWRRRAALGLAPEPIAAPVREAVAARAITFTQGCALVQELDAPEVTPEAGQKVCDAVLAYATAKAAATAAPVGQGLFCRKKRREFIKHVSTRARRARVFRQRNTWVTLGDDGAGSFGVSGADARCLGASRRVDAIARAARAGGDPRTLAQLRSDVALDLLLFGQPHADAPTAVDHPGEGGWPSATVSVVVSAGSLLRLNREPGLVEGATVDTDTVREVAFAAGSTWRRLIADPITGYAMAQVSRSYAPPPRMARAVRERDGICRAPGCDRPAAHCQLDHVVEVRDGGTTRGDTLADECERHHAKKTRRHWAARITPDGVVEWRLPDGRVYPTFPMDYREFGLGADEPEAADAGHDAGNAGPDTGNAGPYAGNAGHDAGREVDDPVDEPPKKVLINLEDLAAIDDDAVAHPRELNRLRDEIACLREELADERAGHAAADAAQTSPTSPTATGATDATGATGPSGLTGPRSEGWAEGYEEPPF